MNSNVDFPLVLSTKRCLARNWNNLPHFLWRVSGNAKEYNIICMSQNLINNCDCVFFLDHILLGRNLYLSFKKHELIIISLWCGKWNVTKWLPFYAYGEKYNFFFWSLWSKHFSNLEWYRFEFLFWLPFITSCRQSIEQQLFFFSFLLS